MGARTSRPLRLHVRAQQSSALVTNRSSPSRNDCTYVRTKGVARTCAPKVSARFVRDLWGHVLRQSFLALWVYKKLQKLRLEKLTKYMSKGLEKSNTSFDLVAFFLEAQLKAQDFWPKQKFLEKWCCSLIVLCKAYKSYFTLRLCTRQLSTFRPAKFVPWVPLYNGRIILFASQKMSSCLYVG